MFKSLYPSVCLEFNIAPNTQIGRINIWNPIKGVYNIPDIEMIEMGGKQVESRPRPIGGLTKGKTYYLRIDNSDNNFVDIYEDYKYTKFIIRAYIEPRHSNEEVFKPSHWKLTEIKIYNQENAFNTDHYMRAGEYIENLVSDNILEFAKRWLGLAGFENFGIDMQEYYQKYLTSYAQNGWYGFIHYYPDRHEFVECPIIDAENRKATK